MFKIEKHLKNPTCLFFNSAPFFNQGVLFHFSSYILIIEESHHDEKMRSLLAAILQTKTATTKYPATNQQVF
jgi:hypothetical protein